MNDLKRVIALPGAVFMGLGSILGTGIFVSIGIAAGVSGNAVLLAVPLAAAVAMLNGLSSAMLAASHPVSGGTYEYGYRYLSPGLGFCAGWLFLCAKSASAATAALGFAGYLLSLAGWSPELLVFFALAAVLALTLLAVGGMHRSNRVNLAIVAVTLVALLCFVIAGLPKSFANSTKLEDFLPARTGDNPGILTLFQGTALLFVAYTGYGRIATLGEEVRDPKRNIPRAIIITLLATAAIYALVAFVAIGMVGAKELGAITIQSAAPLQGVAAQLAIPGLKSLLAFGAITAMLGVLLNLLLGLSRVVLAMARRGDLPAVFAGVGGDHASPRAAVLLVGLIIAFLTAIGNVKTTWSFSAFTVLIYYALTNLAALRLPPEARLYPRWIPVLGLMCSASLAFLVEMQIWLAGLTLIAAGLAVRMLFRSFANRRR